MGDQITNVEMGNGQVEISEGAMWRVKLMSRTERKNLLPGVKSIRGRDQRIDRHSRPSCHMRLSSLITHVRGPGARPARGYFLFITRFISRLLLRTYGGPRPVPRSEHQSKGARCAAQRIHVAEP